VLLVSLPYNDRPWPVIPAFVPVLDSIILLNNLIAAILLYAQYSLARERAVLALATGYLYTGLILVPHFLAALKSWSI
jgi:hypothetical protein